VSEQEVVSLNAWQAYLVCVVYIGLACFLNVMGPKIIDKTSQFFSLSSLFPFVLFIILALFSSHFSFATLVDTSDRKSDVGLYLSVLIWATCGYEYSGFLAGSHHHHPPPPPPTTTHSLWATIEALTRVWW
jgi:amino acid transporter